MPSVLMTLVREVFQVNARKLNFLAQRENVGYGCFAALSGRAEGSGSGIRGERSINNLFRRPCLPLFHRTLHNGFTASADRHLQAHK
ncbi:MAG TPA: hypothetical protein VMD92_03250 [Acidobacteriaceae bacterium]|nr:hypothetical protein [Acidobacteriaceae bacterium]